MAIFVISQLNFTKKNINLDDSHEISSGNIYVISQLNFTKKI